MSKVLSKQEQTEHDFKRLLDWIKEAIPNDWDKFDLKAEYDSSLKYTENKEIVREKLKALNLLKDEKAELEAAQAEQEKFLLQEKVKAEAEVQEYNKKINYEVNKDIDQYYQPIFTAVDKVCRGFSNLLFVKGIGGIGKSFSIRRQLVENNANYLEVAGEVTEAYLYRLLYENNGKIIWLKDVANLLNGLKSINILKAATETEDARVITKNNYSKSQDDLPDRFVCKCKFIFDYNNVQNNMRDDFEALVSRGDFIEFALSAKEMCCIMRSIAKSDSDKEVTEFVINNFKGSGLVRLNLRTQWKAINTYKYALEVGRDWKDEITQELKRVSKIRSMLYSLIGEEAVKRVELKKQLIRYELVPSIRMAEIRINEWLFTDELFEWSHDERNGFVAINPRPKDWRVG